MTPRSVDRSAVGNATLNAAGYATVTITAPDGVIWDVYLTSVSTSVGPSAASTTMQPVATLYEGTTATPSRYLQGTYSGNRDSSDSPYTLLGGDSITAEWVGGTPGTTATLRLRVKQKQV
jgi:hypothetical protein